MNPATSTAVRPTVPISELELCAWCGQAMPGDRLVYFRGFLALDVAPDRPGLTEADRMKLRRLARRAMQLSEGGLIHLVQERLGPARFAYVAVARPKPRHGSVPLTSLLEDPT